MATYALISTDDLSVENTICAEADYAALLTAKGRRLRLLGPLDVVSPGDLYNKATDKFTRVPPVAPPEQIKIGASTYEAQPSSTEPGKFVLVKIA